MTFSDHFLLPDFLLGMDFTPKMLLFSSTHPEHLGNLFPAISFALSRHLASPIKVSANGFLERAQLGNSIEEFQMAFGAS